jgi:hypothetical protein
MFISDSQDVSQILADFGVVDDDIGGIFKQRMEKLRISGSYRILNIMSFISGKMLIMHPMNTLKTESRISVIFMIPKPINR